MMIKRIVTLNNNTLRRNTLFLVFGTSENQEIKMKFNLYAKKSSQMRGFKYSGSGNDDDDDDSDDVTKKYSIFVQK